MNGISNENKRVRFRTYVSVLAGASVFFAAGLAVGVYKIPPYQFLYQVWGTFTNAIGLTNPESGRNQTDLLDAAFSINPAIEGDLNYPPVSNIDDIKALNQMHFVDASTFPNSYDEIRVLYSEQLVGVDEKLPIIKISYSLGGTVREAFVYGKKPLDCNSSRIGSLIIPGSGDNQASAIYLQDESNYHIGIRSALPSERGNYQFVLIKPNHDFLAWHNGKGLKLHGDYYFVWHLNRGGSYSASYIIDGMAATKWIQGCFSETAVAGLSQGGAATLLVALQAEPNYAIVSSGYSLLFRTVAPAGPEQIIGVPGYADLYKEELIIPTLRSTKTQWLFTWGEQEPRIYGQEAKGGPSLIALGRLANVETRGHKEGHVFPTELISKFFQTAGYNTK
jgi:hypothetical protein